MRQWRGIIIIMVIMMPALSAKVSAGWEQQISGTSQDLRGISFGTANSGTAVGGNGTIIRSTDGINWSPQSSGITTLLYDVHFVNGTRGTTVGDDGAILHTSDGGFNWIIAQNGWWITYNATFMYSTDIAFTAGANTIFQPLVERTVNGWTSWDYAIFYLNGNEGRLYDIHFIDDQTGFAAATDWNGLGYIVVSLDGGANWAVQYTFASPLRAIDFPSVDVGYAVGDIGRIIKSTDGGYSWNSQTSGTGANLAGVSFASNDIGTAVGWSGTIIRTTDGGSNWYLQNSGTGVNLNEVDFIDANNGYIAGDNGTILHTSDGGDEGASVPTLSQWGMILLSLLTLAGGSMAVIRRHRTGALASACRDIEL